MLLVTTVWVLTSCTPVGTEERIDLGHGNQLLLTLPDVEERTRVGDRTAYRIRGGLIVTVQHVGLLSETERIDRTAASVAEALVDRVTLGERDGALRRRDCVIGGLDGQCIDGWIRSDGSRFERSGIVLLAGDRVVWLDVASSTLASAELRDHADAVLRGAAVGSRDAVRIQSDPAAAGPWNSLHRGRSSSRSVPRALYSWTPLSPRTADWPRRMAL